MIMMLMIIMMFAAASAAAVAKEQYDNNATTTTTMLNQTSSLAPTSSFAPSSAPTSSPTISPTDSTNVLEIAEEHHSHDAFSTTGLIFILILAILSSYYVKKFRLYHLPESAIALLLGVIVGGIANITMYNDEDLLLFEFSPEVFFFVFLPPIIFEAGYSLNRKDFFDNIGAITLYAVFGTLISTFVVGYGSYIVQQYVPLIKMVTSEVDSSSSTSPPQQQQSTAAGTTTETTSNSLMENLLFGSLISAVDPVATLSIMGNADLKCDRLLYSLVFGESVLNDAVAISLFRTFAKYYSEINNNNNNGDNDVAVVDPTTQQSYDIAWAVLSFLWVSFMSIVLGVGLGLVVSALYRHTELRIYPNFETSLLFLSCYLCYSLGESLGWSGIMALFFQGMVLNHYNSYNLSETAHVASEQIFQTLATLSETAVFLYMGMGVFTGRFSNYDPTFSIFALALCFLGRALNIFPLSAIANLCRKGRSNNNNTTTSSSAAATTTGRGSMIRSTSIHSRASDQTGGSNVADGSRKINWRMQMVLWFAGLRGAIAFALAMNMPGPNRQVYATVTLSICIFTTTICGGLTNYMLTEFGMKQISHEDTSDVDDDEDALQLTRLTFTPPPQQPSYSDSHHYYNGGRGPRRRPGLATQTSRRVYKGAKKLWKNIDDDFLKPYFGGSSITSNDNIADDHLGNYELSHLGEYYSDEEDEDHNECKDNNHNDEDAAEFGIPVRTSNGIH